MAYILLSLSVHLTNNIATKALLDLSTSVFSHSSIHFFKIKGYPKTRPNLNSFQCMCPQFLKYKSLDFNSYDTLLSQDLL